MAISGGGQRVYNVTLRIETDALAAWTAILQDAVGSRGTTSVVVTGNDTGILTALILPPSGTLPGVKAVEMDLSAVRYVVALTARNG